MFNVHFHWDLFLVATLLETAYVYGLLRFRPDPRWLHPIEKRHVVLFTLGVLVLVGVQATPFHDLSDHSFSMHMIQHLLVTLVMPPLLLLGIPSWLLQPWLRNPFNLAVARVLTHPVMAIVAFNAALALWHVPLLYDLAVWDYNIHVVNHLMYILTGLLLWWPVFSPVPELPRLNYPLQMLYLFIQSLVPAILASFMTFSETVIYTSYATRVLLWDMTPLEDQLIGGLIMKVAGGAILWFVAIVIFFRWFFQEEAEAERSWD